MRLVVYGAQGYALGTFEAINSLYPKRKAECFLVTEYGINARQLGGVPVTEIGDFSERMAQEDKDNTEVLIATPENVQDEIIEILESNGFRYYSRLSFERWNELTKLYHVKKGRFLPLEALPVGCHRPRVSIYMARSHKDRPLKNSFALPEYILPIQVGAANTDQRVEDITDDTGDNISEKNVNYSEVTGLYWLWKNRLCSEEKQLSDLEKNSCPDDCYYGLFQYRRMFQLSDDDLLRLIDNEVDVVLPFPLPYEPDINAHHERYLKDSDWKAVLSAINELQPEYGEAFPAILNQKYLYNYNVILAKKKVLLDYSEWLFPILQRTEELSIPKGSERADRYIGYVAETLETLYFMKNSDKMNIVHKACRLFV